MAEKMLLNKIEKIVSGNEVGSLIKVVDDRANTGRLFNLTSASRALKTGFDNWVDSPTALIKYHQECHWQIKWEVS